MDENPIHKHPADDGPLSSFGKVAGINLGVMLLYAIGSLAMSESAGSEASMSFVILMAMLIAAHFFLLVVVSVVLLIAGKKSSAIAGFLSIPVVLLVGFGTCIGLGSVM